jgi:NAD-dependent dihydropyrimidine dehydrogenase PreA subunit
LGGLLESRKDALHPTYRGEIDSDARAIVPGVFDAGGRRLMQFMGESAHGPRTDDRERDRVTIVLSRVSPDDHGARAHQEALQRALFDAKLDFVLVDPVYDQYEPDPQIAYLRGIKGDLVFMGWHFPRALKWTLARHDIEVNGEHRNLHLLDVREMAAREVIERVVGWIGDRPTTPAARAGMAADGGAVVSAHEEGEVESRWYPVVDHERCTNCMECLDFCLFGVYGVDHEEQLRVVQPDECRADCPACSRVCPAGAIIFPAYRTNPSIAGGDESGESPGVPKLDLSKIFGKPKARHLAALERDRELNRNGRKPAGAEKMDRLADDFDKVEI